MNTTRFRRTAAALGFVLGGPAAAGNSPLETIVPAPAMPEPSYLEAVRDPAFGTEIVRITEPGRAMAGGRCDRRFCTHHYSSSQAWNADQTLLVITNDCSDACFLDGRTYRALFHRAMPNECEWHPVDPSVMICVGGQSVYTWDPRTNRVGTNVPLPAFKRAQFGPYKGNPSASGDRIVVRAQNDAGHLVAFAVDLPTGRLHAPIALDSLPGENNACTISASGRYIVCLQDLPDERETLHVFTAEGEPIQQWTEHHRPGHGDLTTDTDGADVYVGISKSEPDLFHVIKRRLKDGVVTDLLPYGQASHASLRNTKRPGWVFLSFEGTLKDVEDAPENGRTVFYQEVVALRIDGSGTLRRLAQTRNATVDYRSETHATPSPDGTRVLFSSNWGDGGGPVSDYVAIVPWPPAQAPAVSVHSHRDAPQTQAASQEHGHAETRR